jgi:DNA-binding beta-propeller fold protein YncE
LYGISGYQPSEVVVIDTAAKTELTRISLPGYGADIDMSPNGEWLVVALQEERQLLLLDADRSAIQGSVPVVTGPAVVEVDDTGVAYYAEQSQWVQVRRVALNEGITSDTQLELGNIYAPDLELARDGTRLYVGESGGSGCNVYEFDLTATPARLVATGSWSDGEGFVNPPRSVLLSPGTERVYYGQSELLGGDLKTIPGLTRQTVFAEDRAGTFAVGEKTLFDVVTLQTLAKLPHTATAAALTNQDKVLWYYDAASGDGHYANVADFLGTAALGVRELAPLPLSSYTLSRLVADPKRHRLYAIDSTRDIALAIDSDTLQPLAAVAVGTFPTDLALDFAADTLFVGHVEALGIVRIDLADFSFERFMTEPRVPYELETLSDGRLAMIDEDQSTTPSLIDDDTGAVLARAWGPYDGILSATADGKSLFVGDSNLTGCNMTRYDVSGNALVFVGETSYDNGYGFPNAQHWELALPDGSGVFYANYLIDGNDLSKLRYPIGSAVRAVTPDGKLATTSDSVFDVKTGKTLGTLATAGDVQAIDATGQTLYVASAGTLTKLDLTPFR